MQRAGLILAIFLLAAPAARAASATAEPATFRSIFEQSIREKRPLTIRVRGQAVSGIAVKVLETAVEVRKPDHARVLIRLDRIEAVALD